MENFHVERGKLRTGSHKKTGGQKKSEKNKTRHFKENFDLLEKKGN